MECFFLYLYSYFLFHIIGKDMIRKGRNYIPEEILPLIGSKKVDLDGDKVKLNSKRLYVFKESLVCYNCGIEGRFFVKEKNENDISFHLNLYAIDDDGNEILMTKDHVIPKSRGGSNKLKNLKTMCSKCNQEKGDDTNFSGHASN
jgi:hypothetical protein